MGAVFYGECVNLLKAGPSATNGRCVTLDYQAKLVFHRCLETITLVRDVLVLWHVQVRRIIFSNHVTKATPSQTLVSGHI